MKHVMIDLETFGLLPGAPILQIAAIEFDPATGQTGVEFNVKIRFDSAIKKAQLPPSGATLEWWFGEPEAAAALLEGGDEKVSLKTALGMLTEYLTEVCYDDFRFVEVWSNGAANDIPQLNLAYHACGMESPWHYRNVRDCRTVEALSKVTRASLLPFLPEGITHDALHDCHYQIAWLCPMLNSLK